MSNLFDYIKRVCPEANYRYEATSENEVVTVNPENIPAALSQVAEAIQDGWVSPFIELSSTPKGEVWVREVEEEE